MRIKKGDNRLVARVWSLGARRRPAAQQSIRPGFFLAPDGVGRRDFLATGYAPWRVRILPGREFLEKGPCFGTSAFEKQAGIAGDIAWRRGEGDDWIEPAVGPGGVNRGGVYQDGDRHRLTPGTLPPMMEEPLARGKVRHLCEPPAESVSSQAITGAENLGAEAGDWQSWWDGRSELTIPPHTRRRAIVDLDGYFCAYPEIETRGGEGSKIRLHWAEALYREPRRADDLKDQRDEIENRHFIGFGDAFYPNGRPGVFDTLWWRCGRYVELLVETRGEALTLVRADLRETRYPYEWQGAFESDDPDFDRCLPILERGLAMCAHETFMDCPYYEQLMYGFDSVIMSRIMLATSPDSRMPRKMLAGLADTRLANGMTRAAFSGTGMVITTFGLWWIKGLLDHTMWRDDPVLLKRLLPCGRSILDYWMRGLRADGLVLTPEGWNFLDWAAWNEYEAAWRAPGWTEGWHTAAPPGGLPGQVSYTLNWLLVCACEWQAELEGLAGEREMAARWNRLADEAAAALNAAAWSDGAGLYFDSPSRKHLSQHTQILALMTDRVPVERRAAAVKALAERNDLVEATLAFADNLLEVYYREGMREAFDARLEEWRLMPDRGMKTGYEVRWDYTRSDCHGWASSPLFHACASLLGIRPAAPGFAKIHVSPLLGPGRRARGTLPHPKGTITVDLRREGDDWHGAIEIPDGVPGEFAPPGATPREFVRRLELS